MRTMIFGAGTDLGVHIDGANLGPTQLLNDIKSFYKGESITLNAGKTIIKSRNLSDRKKNEYEINQYNLALYKIMTEKIKEEYFPIVNELRYFHDGKIIQPSRTVLIGGRQLDDKEKDNVRYSGITVFSEEDIREKGIEAVMDEAFKIAGFKTKGVHVTFDLDIIDPEISPGISSPAFDGITEEEAMKINECLVKHMKEILSYDLVELNPLRDIGRKTEQIALNLLSQIIVAAEKKQKWEQKNYY